MFGIGFGELVVILVVLLIVVGPDRMPGLMRSAGKTLRQVRKATNDLRAQTGIDELLRDPDPLGVRDLEASLRADLARGPERRMPLEATAVAQELPTEGTDLAVAREHATRGTTPATADAASAEHDEATMRVDAEGGAPVADADTLEGGAGSPEGKVVPAEKAKA